VHGVRRAESRGAGAEARRFAKHVFRDGEQSHGAQPEEALVVGDERRVTVFQRTDQRLHETQGAADELDALRVRRLPERLKDGDVCGVALDRVDDDRRVDVDEPGRR
jgi:hypothetical protein